MSSQGQEQDAPAVPWQEGFRFDFFHPPSCQPSSQPWGPVAAAWNPLSEHPQPAENCRCLYSTINICSGNGEMEARQGPGFWNNTSFSTILQPGFQGRQQRESCRGQAQVLTAMQEAPTAHCSWTGSLRTGSHTLSLHCGRLLILAPGFSSGFCLFRTGTVYLLLAGKYLGPENKSKKMTNHTQTCTGTEDQHQPPPTCHLDPELQLVPHFW